MKSLVFSKRNFKEILRDPLSLIFCFLFPIGLLIILQIIMSGIPTEARAQTPQFQIEKMTASISVFSFSFLTLFSGMLISKDRTTSFQSRLLASPMKAIDFIIGYTLPLIPIALIQSLVTFLCCFIFGLQLSWNLLLGFIVLIPSGLLFIAFGLLIGSLFSDKSVGGVSSILINIAAILGGMFFPLESMSGFLVTLTNILPFAPALKLCSSAILGNYSAMIVPFFTVVAYVVVIFIIAVLVFKKKFISLKK